MAGLDLSMTGSRNESLLSPGGGGDRSDMDTSPYKSSDSTCSTPRKNKRKSSEPKRRSDFSIKRFCPDTPHALGPELDSEEGGGRPGYGEHPPSTPETSASSSTPSPPDVTQLRIPNVVTSRHRNSARPASPTSHRVTSTSPEMTSSTHAPPPHLAAQPAFMAAAAPYGLNMAYMPVNPVLLQHMMALQQQQLAGVPVAIPPPPQHLATAAATATTPLPVPSSSQLPAAPKRKAPSSQTPAAVDQNNTHLSSSSRTGSSHHQAPAISATSGGSSKTPSRSSHNSRSSRESRESRTQSVNTSRDLSHHSRTSVSANESLNVSTTSQFSDSLCPSDNEGDLDGSRRSRKNYKNMTRERRIEANARERSRVHTISAAFETLRRTVPSFSHTQRLSKLAILRIACSYISALATMAGHDLSPPGHSQDSFEESVDQCTKTIQNEGRAKRRH